MTKPDTPDSGPLLLRRAVAMTRDAKTIVARAESIELTALNSVFAVRRVGTANGGFGVISKELRTFSRELTCQMNQLADDVTALVPDLAAILKQARRHALMTQGVAGDERRQRLTASLRTQAERLARETERVHLEWQAVNRIVQRAVRLCGNGLHLARNARLEACRMGHMTATLNKVADDVAEAIQTILSLLAPWKEEKRHHA